MLIDKKWRALVFSGLPQAVDRPARLNQKWSSHDWQFGLE